VLSSEGARAVDRAEHDALCERAAEFDLFVDASVAPAWGLRPGGATRRRERLQPSERRVLVGVIESPRAVRLTSILTEATAASAIKAFETARRKVDANVERTTWRFFARIAGSAAASHTYRFQPPPGSTWCVLLPLEADARSAR
jgi:hypothetical protein